MKKVIIVILLFSLFTVFLVVRSCIVSNITLDDSVVVTTTIIKITEGSSNDIVFHDNGGDRYYINRGLERGLNLDDLNTTVLNKTVTLHLAKVFGGMATSEHISQLVIGDTIIFTEFD
ncbi:hypothetical protein [Pontimicrobium sp. SW4]|uniref:Uncharacterized protein n=1 Tax=Pontimicrobium sp. SW4 TaxID=3153519 RepID=A0AAU7BT77_9FLAO